MELSSFITSFSTTFALFMFFVLVFTWLSRKPGYSVIYYPNRIVKGLRPYDLKKRSPFAWIKESFTSTEDEIISISGVDTAVYFVFLSTVLKILVLSGTFLLPSLLPIAWTANSTNVINGNISNIERLSMANVDEKSPRLWAFLLATYVVSFSTFYMLWKAYDHISKLRVTALSAPDVKPEQYAILVKEIPTVPEGKTRKEQVDSYFESLYADEFYKSMVITDNKEVNKIWEDLTKYKNKLAHAEAKFAASKTTDKPEGTRPISKKWFLFGKKVDTINFCQEKLDTLVPKLKTEQEKTIREKQKNSALIFFKNRKAATSVAQTIHAKEADPWTVDEAPEPRQVLWKNLGLEYYQLQLRKKIFYLIVALTILFYMIPTMIISAFSEYRSFIKKRYNKVLSPDEVVLEAYLPQIALIAFLSLLPKFLIYLSKAQGLASVSHVVIASSDKHFFFTMLNVLIGINVGVAWIKGKFTSMDDFMAMGVVTTANATFFLSFVALKLFAGYGLELSRSFSFIMFLLKKKFFCRTDAEVKKAWAPGDMNYAFRVPDDLLIVTIVLFYSTIAPIIILFGVAYFSIGWLVLRNQALNVYIPSYESYGLMWPRMYFLIILVLGYFQVIMIMSFILKKFYYAPLVPLPILTIAFIIVCKRKFGYGFSNTDLEVVHTELRETPNLEAIYKAYIPPCLRSEDEAQPVDDPLSVSLFQPPGFQSLL